MNFENNFSKPDPEKILQEVMKNKRVSQRVKELKLSKEQVFDALPILIDMSLEKDEDGIEYLTNFYLAEDKSIQRSKIKSSWFKQFSYRDNIVTQKISHIDFEDNKDFIKEASRARIVNNMSQYLENDGEYKKGMYIYGSMGIGKTFVLKRMAKKLAENNKKVGFFVVQDLVQKIKGTFKNDDSYHNIVEDVKNVDYLFIDDIGAEQISSWFRDDILFSILNYRMDKEKTTFFSSNYSYEQLEKIQSKTFNSKSRDNDKSARLLSRIESLTFDILMEGKNKR